MTLSTLVLSRPDERELDGRHHRRLMALFARGPGEGKIFAG